MTKPTPKTHRRLRPLIDIFREEDVDGLGRVIFLHEVGKRIVGHGFYRPIKKPKIYTHPLEHVSKMDKSMYEANYKPVRVWAGDTFRDDDGVEHKRGVTLKKDDGFIGIYDDDGILRFVTLDKTYLTGTSLNKKGLIAHQVLIIPRLTPKKGRKK